MTRKCHFFPLSVCLPHSIPHVPLLCNLRLPDLPSCPCPAQLVELLCDEMALAFKERGAPVPPWRKPSSLISKWKLSSPVPAGLQPGSAL